MFQIHKSLNKLNLISMAVFVRIIESGQKYLGRNKTKTGLDIVMYLLNYSVVWCAVPVGFH